MQLIDFINQNRDNEYNKWINLNGFPTKKHDTWKYTNIKPILDYKNYQFSKSNNIDNIDHFRLDDSIDIVIINGSLANNLSNYLDYTDITISEINDNEFNDPTNAFDALRKIEQKVIEIKVKAKARIVKPINLIHITCENQLSLPRVNFVIEEQAEATLLEQYCSLDNKPYFINTEVNLNINSEAKLRHYKIQNESITSYHIANNKIKIEKLAQYNCYNFMLGGAIARNETDLHLVNKKASSNIWGLFIAEDGQNQDNQLIVKHPTPDCTSDQQYRGIIAGNGSGVFDGLIWVDKDSVKTKADMTNKNLLLSEASQIFTRPRLEIYADDVVCTHGATSGQIEEDVMQYIRSRGISKQAAKQMLTSAFANEIVNKIPDQNIQAYINDIVSKKMQNLANYDQ